MPRVVAATAAVEAAATAHYPFPAAAVWAWL